MANISNQKFGKDHREQGNHHHTTDAICRRVYGLQLLVHIWLIR